MVMIPVGNHTRHSFRLWVIVEIYVRICIAALLMSKLTEVSSTAYWVAIIIFSAWAWRPLYVETKHLYLSYRDANVGEGVT